MGTAAGWDTPRTLMEGNKLDDQDGDLEMIVFSTREFRSMGQRSEKVMETSANSAMGDSDQVGSFDVISTQMFVVHETILRSFWSSQSPSTLI